MASRHTALLTMGAMGLLALAGTALPEEAAAAVFSSWLFWAVAAGLVASVTVSLAARARTVRSVRALGSWLMHFSVVVLCAGSVYNRIGAREVDLEAIEGQAVALPEGGCSLELAKLRPFYREGRWEKGEAAEVSVSCPKARPRRQVIHANRPMKVGGMRIFLEGHGFAPLVQSMDPLTGSIYGGFVSLATVMGRTVRYWREVGPPDFPVSAVMVFRPAPQGPYPRQPRLKLAVKGGPSAVLSPGRDLSLGGYRFRMGEVRYWARFRIRKDPGLRLVFAGFWVAVAGASAALLPRVFGAGA